MTFTLTEDDINGLHKQEYAEAAERYGSIYTIPWDIVYAIGQRTRERWCKWVEERDRGVTDGPQRTHDKTKRINDFLAAKVGKHITIDLLMEAAECSRGTAYKYIADNRSMFVKVDTGVYRVVDVSAARAAAGRPTTPAPSHARPSDPSPTMTTARAESDAAMDALRRMTGGTNASE